MTAAPQLLASGPRPEWHYPVSRDGKVLDLHISVMVDATGHPDMSTLTVAGLGAFENRDAITVWVGDSLFRAAQQGDHPVSALYETQVQVKRVTRRM